MITEYIPVEYRRSVGLPEVIDTGCVWQTVEWCRAYGPDQGQRPLLRFAIGVYQINGLLNWRGTDAAAESAAAFAIHVTSAAEMVCPRTVSVAHWIPVDRWEDVNAAWPRFDATRLLQDVATLNQQYCYITTCKPGTIRYARISPQAIALFTATAVMNVMSLTRATRRAAAVETAMQMLLDLEWARREKSK